MSMLRCLYRRLKFVKCALGEPGTSSIHLKVSTNSRASYQCIITRNLHGMTCDKNNTAGSSESAAAVANGKADNSLVRNGLIVDSALRSGGGSFLSNGYYRTEWGQQGSGNQTNGEKARRGNTSKCEFDLNFINVRLLGLLVSTFFLSAFTSFLVATCDTDADQYFSGVCKNALLIRLFSLFIEMLLTNEKGILCWRHLCLLSYPTCLHARGKWWWQDTGTGTGHTASAV